MKLEKISGKANQNLYRHPKTGVVYFQMSKKGRGRIERSTGTDNLSEARRIADEIRFKFLGKRSPAAGRKLNKELFADFLETKVIRRHSTYRRYQQCWEHLKHMLEDVGPEDVTEKWWEGVYIPAKRAHEPDRKFFNERKTLNAFLRFCRQEGLIERLPKLFNPDQKSEVGKVYTDDEVNRLIAAANDDMKLQILMAVTMGMRKSEILLLAANRVDAKNRFIHLRAQDTKTGKPRTFAISGVVWPLLQPRLLHISGFVFPARSGVGKPVYANGNQTAWDGCRRRAKVQGRFHDLRHTFLTKAFAAPNSNAALICHAAGLSLETAQRVYLHFKPEHTRSVMELVRFNA
jgi:integrase